MTKCHGLREKQMFYEFYEAWLRMRPRRRV
jgi:hypothetical protein